jgi:hypothetical protein
MELPAGDQVGKVEPERGHVLGQILVALLEADEQAGLSEPGRATHQEGHGQQGLAAAGAAAYQSRPPFWQTTPCQVIESDNSRNRLFNAGHGCGEDLFC